MKKILCLLFLITNLNALTQEEAALKCESAIEKLKLKDGQKLDAAHTQTYTNILDMLQGKLRKLKSAHNCKEYFEHLDQCMLGVNALQWYLGQCKIETKPSQTQTLATELKDSPKTSASQSNDDGSPVPQTKTGSKKDPLKKQKPTKKSDKPAADEQ
jgi:hypothetical protein